MTLERVSSPTALHPAIGGPKDGESQVSVNKGAFASSLLDRPKTSSAAHRLFLNTAKATRSADDLCTPSTAVPVFGGGSSNSLTSDTAGTWPWVAAPTRAEYLGHHRSTASHDSIPRQTIIKALTSSLRKEKPEALSLDNMLATQKNDTPGSAASSQKLADALQDLARKQSTPVTALTDMQSPCFYHQRFDDAVDIEKVLEEIKNDESMSHSRLVQTATGVREVSKQLQRRPIKRAVRNVMIVTKARDHQLVYLTRELTTWLLHTPRYGSDLGINVYVDAKLRSSKRFDAPGILAENPRFKHMLRYWTPDLCWSQPERFDLVLTLGGDGTVLFTSWLFQRIVPPVLSFSLGSLGFMTTFEFEKYKAHLNRVMGDEGMKINLRMRFTCTVRRQDAGSAHVDETEQFEVLNELVIDRGPSPYVSNLELYGDDELLTVVQADGCIFSTPTGSTAYSLSAGGSLVHPDIPAILLTPICPHTLSFRPMVLSDTMALRVAVPRNSRATAYCAFDGKGRIELRQGDHVTITASQYPFPTVTRTDTEWFDSVSRTLRWNVRAASQKPFDLNATLDSIAPQDEDDTACWDIDTDSAYFPSEEGSVSASPIRRQMSMLGL
ncbi:NAD kinase associated with ferric reductase [Metarhizium rileyi]|uniref:NAD kinase associated with ferric reductase n=1 Tax=Metarhizium rileyi (strain RCEF 4871) TaxID=1649241 RepID=A0A162M264_METRR|nr:NAD kinase associated with ferric reductase [Metarhizium rileyi RCEF 4871]TWU77924.1 NAD(+) kinase [Metarhizium rileyi]